jgi:predicted AAA+ superfamily ATPase
MQSISQSLAGRTAVLTLAPLSIHELKEENRLPESPEELMLKGFYPALYDRDLSAEEYFPSYVQTYIERDVRLLRNIPDANSFIRFIRLLAIRSGQVINQTELAGACGISVPTLRAWLSVLIQSYLVFELSPYYNNYSKRLVKSSKLYFYDTGLLCHLLGIENQDQLRQHDLKGAIFETMIVSEYMKSRLFKAKTPAGYFWRDTNQNEVDLLTEDEKGLRAFEIKASHTADRSFLKGLYKFADLSGLNKDALTCIYSGDRSLHGEQGSFVNYSEVF